MNSAAAYGRLRKYDLTEKGKIRRSMLNLYTAVSEPGDCGFHFRKQKNCEIECSTDGGKTWEQITRADYFKLQMNLEKLGLGHVGKSDLKDCVLLVAIEGGISK